MPHRLLERDRFAARLGARLVVADPDRLVVELELEPAHFDAGGRVSGGVLFSLADCAMSLISNHDRAAVAIATHLTRQGEGRGASVLTAGVRPAGRREGRTVTWLAGLEGDGETLATFVGTTYVVNDDPLPT